MDCKLFYEQQMSRLANAFKALNFLYKHPRLYVNADDLSSLEFKSYVAGIKKDCNILGIELVFQDRFKAGTMPYIVDNHNSEYNLSNFNMDGYKNSAIARGILELIKAENVSKNMPIAVFGKSYNVGGPIIISLIKEGYMVKVLDSKSTKQEVQHCLDTCYWFILCANKPIIYASQFLNGSYVLDCGYSIIDGKACGNVIYDLTEQQINDDKVSISDIHNGVNLLTRIGLLYNLLDFYLGVGI